MLKPDISRRAAKFLEGLDAKQARQIARKITALLSDPRPADARPLKGYAYLRADLGEYRIIYRIEDDRLVVALIGKRNDDEIYRQLRRS
jgi:mRNA interferase RelE/StbE